MALHYRMLLIWTLTCSVPIAVAQPQTETIIRDGDIVTAGGQRTADIRIVGSTIAEIGTGLTARDERTLEIDAEHHLVLPGGIDPHVHLGGNRVDDYTSGSAAALAGGITTISNFGGVQPGESPIEALTRATNQIETQSIADVIFHPIISDPTSATADTLSALVSAGQTSVKIFMVRPSFDRNAPGFLTMMYAANSRGLLTMLHCEDAAIIEATASRLVAMGRGSLEFFGDARPVSAEVAATQRAVAMAEVTGSPIYIVHLSSARALQVAENAQARGLPVFVETRPLYLHLTRERFSGPNPGLYIGQPPLRTLSDQDALWEGIARGSIHVIGSDHVAYTREEKLDPSQTVVRHRAGMSNLQEMLPMIFSEGVRTGRITLERFVEVTATNPAKLFGLYPRKGTIAVGSDADLTVWDPAETRTIRNEDMLSASRYSVHAGKVVTGWPTMTLRRGEIVYQNREITGSPGSGELLQRTPWQDPRR